MANGWTAENMANAWVGFDLDGTLARDDVQDFINEIGPPVPEVLQILKNLLAMGMRVRIVTARVFSGNPDREHQIQMVETWLMEHLGQLLPVQAEKDPAMICIFDDRVVAVERNTGRLFAWPSAFPEPKNPTV